MSKIGDMLAGHDQEFVDWFEVPLRITNYEHADQDTAPDEFDSVDEKQETADSPIETTGQVELVSATGDSSPWGRDTNVDVEIYVPDDVLISDGEVTDLPYASDVTHVPSSETYRIVDRHDEGNGRVRCAAQLVT